MKKEFAQIPEAMKGITTYGFSWMDFLLSIPSPIFLVTGYKANGKPNACLQSWSTFIGDEQGYYCVMASVNKDGHMYRSVKETGAMVLNFPSAEFYAKCSATIQNNAPDCDEITASGLTAEPAVTVHAPRVKECFLNLECEYLWERERHPGDRHVVMCVQVRHIAMEEAHFDEEQLGRYGESGYLYNVHQPVNPLNGQVERDSVAILNKLFPMA